MDHNNWLRRLDFQSLQRNQIPIRKDLGTPRSLQRIKLPKGQEVHLMLALGTLPTARYKDTVDEF